MIMSLNITILPVNITILPRSITILPTNYNNFTGKKAIIVSNYNKNPKIV